MEGHRAHRRARVGAQLKRTMGRARPVAMAMARLGRQWERNHPGPVDSIACRGLGSPCARQAVELGTTRTDDWVAWYRGIRSHRRMPPARATKHGKETGLAGAAYLGLRRLLAPDTAMLHRESTSAIVSIAARQSRRHRVPVHVTPPRRATALPGLLPLQLQSPARQSFLHPAGTRRVVLRIAAPTAGPPGLSRCSIRIIPSQVRLASRESSIVGCKPAKIRHRERLGAAHSVMIPEIYNSASSTLMTASDSASTSSLLMSGLT